MAKSKSKKPMKKVAAKTKSPVKAPVKSKAAVKAKAPVKTQAKTSVKAKAKSKPKIQAKSKANSKSKALASAASQKSGKASKAMMPTAKSSSKDTTSTEASKSAKMQSKKGPNKISNWETFLTPLDDRLIVEVAEGEKMTAGGLYIPDTVDATGNFKGTVLVVGRGHRDPKKGHMRPMDVKAGDIVLFAEHSGTKMAFEGQDVKILRESEILGIVLKN